MAIDVRKIEIKSVMDAAGLDEWVTSGDVAADEIVAVIGKTEGNGGVKARGL
jgi:cyanuric acid amidohydrolase